MQHVLYVTYMENRLVIYNKTSVKCPKSKAQVSTILAAQ